MQSLNREGKRYVQLHGMSSNLVLSKRAILIIMISKQHQFVNPITDGGLINGKIWTPKKYYNFRALSY